MDAWVPKFLSEDDNYSFDDEESNDFDKGRKVGVLEFDKPNDETDVEKVSESSFMNENNIVQENVTATSVNSPLFSPITEPQDDGEINIPPIDQNKPTSSFEVLSSKKTSSIPITGGSILNVMDDLLRLVRQWANTFSKIASKWGDLVVWEESEEVSLSCKHLCLKIKINEIINDCFKIIIKSKVYWIRAKEMDAWVPKFLSEDDNYSSDDEESNDFDRGRKVGDMEFNKPNDETDVEKVSESSFMNENNIVQENVTATSVNSPLSADPFNIYELLQKKNDTTTQSNDSDPSHPLGLGHKAKKGWIKELCSKHKINFVIIQESKMESINLFSIRALWGNLTFDHAVSAAIGNSRGILCVWDPNMFIKQHVSSSDYFLAIMGTWTPTSIKLLVISIYAPQDLSKKKELWDYVCSLVDRWDGEIVIMGDFNEVRTEHVRFGSIFNVRGANAFNNFISKADLIDLPLGGYSYTWSHKSASKMSKLDRFLISKGLLIRFPHLSGLCLDRHLSDHRPIIMFESSLDYGPTPFRMFHSWSKMEGFDKFMESSWLSMNITDPNGLIRMKKKLQLLKNNIKSWVKENKTKLYAIKSSIIHNLSEVDKIIDQGGGNDEIINKRSLLMTELHDINSIDALDLSEKAKVRWSIEGDENTKYFHGILNRKRNQLAIRGILHCGDWIVEPSQVKTEFFNYFSNQFSKPSSSRLNIDFEFPTRLNLEQVEELERSVSFEEIKKAVWDCGTNKSLGPDGFSFEFFHSHWNTLNQDIVAAVHEFFATGSFPPGCNSTFIALIPKIINAKVVKDYRHISLIGSLYKVIAKILANRLSLVMSDLISDVQTTFVSNRQILDGPFILNELFSWCKYKKINAMIFKVDFEKAFDSVRWDYLNDVFKSFGFGEKWRSWINGCLVLSMGSVLVNGSPTQEFHFHKGLKQGDPLSPFLFILIMESLHLSFTRVLDSGLFKGINISNSLSLSHLFYADDAVFIGKWDINNIKTIVNVLKCFFLASGLKINLHKSKLTGIRVSKDQVDLAASLVGCSTFYPPFHYLGVKVAASMSRLNSWKDVISKLSSRLSKWKLKTLSIGGRLALLKSILTAIPLYYMSLYKAPAGILKDMESIRRRFFNGAEKTKGKWFGLVGNIFWLLRKMEVLVFLVSTLQIELFYSSGCGVFSLKNLHCGPESLKQSMEKKVLSTTQPLLIKALFGST
ncbi:RNA-directed DNA polymerase, eukaryota [Tanacetum coccineum]